METLVVFNRNLYLLPPGLGEDYTTCHGCVINETESPKDALDRTEHLAYMLGVERWYDNGEIPDLPAFLERLGSSEETASRSTGEACAAPWAMYKIEGQVVNLTFGSVLVIVCGWLV